MQHGQAIEKPSLLGRRDFVAHFGGVFEHSPWIAERAWLRGLHSGNDTPEGLHHALAVEFRGATRLERLEVLRRHPELLGKPASEMQMTAESTREQSMEALNGMSEGERDRIIGMNRLYSERFGFPFIIAVRDNSRKAIVDAFVERLSNSYQQEFRTACAEVERIAFLRVCDCLRDAGIAT